MSIDFDTLITRSDPLWGHEPPDAQSTAGRQLYERLLTGSLPEPRKGNSRRVHLAIGSVAVAAVIACALLLVLQSAPPASAAAELSHIARIVAAQEPSTLLPSQSLYSQRSAMVELTFTNVNGIAVPAVTADIPMTIDIWMKSDGYVAVGERLGTARFASSAAQSAWTAAGLPVQLPDAEQYFMSQGTEGVPPVGLDVSGLPVDATALGALIESGDTGIPQIDRISPGPDAISERVTLLLLGPDIGATPQFYSSLYKILSTVPGVTQLGAVTTHSGQTGEAFAVGPSGVGEQERLIVNPDTGRLLEAQNVVFGQDTLKSDSSTAYTMYPTFQMLNRMAEPRTLGSSVPSSALWISATSTDQIVSDSTLPSQARPPDSPIVSQTTTSTSHAGLPDSP